MSKRTTNFNYVLLVLLLTIIAVTFFDIIGVNLYINSSNFNQQESLYWTVIWGVSSLIGITVTIVYYILRRDITESLALLLSFFVVLASGIEDILFYLLQSRAIPTELPWLNNAAQSFVSRLSGFTTVTNFTLILNSVLFISLLVIVILYMRRK